MMRVRGFCLRDSGLGRGGDETLNPNSGFLGFEGLGFLLGMGAFLGSDFEASCHHLLPILSHCRPDRNILQLKVVHLLGGYDTFGE